MSELLDAWEDPDRPRPSPWSPKHAAGVRWGRRHGYLVTAPERLIGDVHWAGQREVEAHEQGTDPLWVPQDQIPSHTDVAALYKAMAGLCRKGEPTALALLVAAYSGVRMGELRALRGSDVDTRRRLIRVTRQVAEVDGVPTTPLACRGWSVSRGTVDGAWSEGVRIDWRGGGALPGRSTSWAL